jgi:4-amino-4-deoxy-L-arabinose transferase-like glycosyltransferase
MSPDTLFWPDPKHYYSIARGLTEGSPYSTHETVENLYRSPGYPFVLSLMMKIVGTDLVNLRLFHIALFPVFLFTLYKLGTLWKGKLVGLISVLFAVLYPYYIYQPLTLYPESFLVYMFPGMLMLMLLLRNNIKYYLLALLSGLIALAIMIRPTSVYLIPVAFFLIAWRNGLQIKRIIAVGAILALIPVVTVCTWMVRNEIVHGNLIFSTAGSKNLLMSYNENATWRKKVVLLPSCIRKRVDATKDVFEKQEIYKEEVIKYLENQPIKAFTIAFMQCLDLWNPIPRTTTKNGFSQLKFKIVVAIPYIFLLMTGFIGVRYRLVTDFAFIIMAAYAIGNLVTKFIKSDQKCIATQPSDNR